MAMTAALIDYPSQLDTLKCTQDIKIKKPQLHGLLNWGGHSGEKPLSTALMVIPLAFSIRREAFEGVSQVTPFSLKGLSYGLLVLSQLPPAGPARKAGR